MLLLLAKPLLSGHVYVNDDFGMYNLPVRHFYREALAAGDSFLWFPRVFCGAYLHGEGQVGMCHPVHLLLYRALPLQIAFNLELLLTYAWMFGGMCLLLKRLGLPQHGRLFGALAFTFSGSNLLHASHMNAVAIIAHIPWLLASIDVLLQTHDRRKLTVAQLSIALLTGSEFLLGHPQYAWLSLVLETIFFVWRYNKSIDLRRIFLIVVAKITGGMIGAIQILPTLDVLTTSVRSQPTLEYRLIGSLHPINLIQLVSPFVLKDRVFGMNTTECGLYTGVFCVLAPIWLYLRRDSVKSWRPLILAATGLGAAMFLLALGKYGGVYYLVVNLPVAREFRIPGRYLHFVHLALALLAAIAFCDLVEFARERERLSWRQIWPLTVPMTLSILVAVGCLLLFKTHRNYPWMDNLAPPGHAVFGALLITARFCCLAWRAAGAWVFLP